MPRGRPPLSNEETAERAEKKRAKKAAYMAAYYHRRKADPHFQEQLKRAQEKQRAKPDFKKKRAAAVMRRYHADPEKARAKIYAMRERRKAKLKEQGLQPNSTQLEYAKRNRDKINERRNKRYRDDPSYRILQTMRVRLRNAFLDAKAGKPRPFQDFLGCTLPELLQHLQDQFQPGMSLDNYGEWVVDHVKPCCSFDLTDPAQAAACFHYTNLQPLWHPDNLLKAVTSDRRQSIRRSVS